MYVHLKIARTVVNKKKGVLTSHSRKPSVGSSDLRDSVPDFLLTKHGSEFLIRALVASKGR
jgi:hypothetical protein